MTASARNKLKHPGLHSTQPKMGNYFVHDILMHTLLDTYLECAQLTFAANGQLHIQTFDTTA